MEHTNTQHAFNGINSLKASEGDHNKPKSNANFNMNFEIQPTIAFTESQCIKIDEFHNKWWKEEYTRILGEKNLESDSTDILATSKAIHKHKQPGYLSKKKAAGNKSHALNQEPLQQGETCVPDSPISGRGTRNSYTLIRGTAIQKTTSNTQIEHLGQFRPHIKRAALRLNTKYVKDVKVQALGWSVMDKVYTDVEELVLNQSQYDYGFSLQVRLSSQVRKICMDLIFDAGSDVIFLRNTTGSSAVFIKQLPPAQDNDVRLEFMCTLALDVSSYGVYMSDEHIFDLIILPRCYMSLSPSCHSQLRGTNKRAFVPSSSEEDPTANKRAKIEEMSQESSASTLFQTAPTHPLVDEPTASTLINFSNLDMSAVSSLSHPLEKLQLGHTVKIFSDGRENDYELTREADLSVRGNSLVCKAYYSRFPKRTVVVKIWRSKSDFTTKPSSAPNGLSTGRHWLNEVKIHSDIGLHPSIATLYGFDARLLSIYMEYVDSPSLEVCRDLGRNDLGRNYCKLDFMDARRVLYGMADALSFIHQKGFTHDDIKPGNILYSRERGPVLIDFGCSSRGIDHCAGSPWYIPPEYMWNGKRGFPGDVFALGVVLLFLLCQIPLPELQSPTLNWRIADLRSVDPVALAAVNKMKQWLKEVKRAAKELNNVLSKTSDKDAEYIILLIRCMLEFDPKNRMTAEDLFLELRRL